MSRRDAAAGPAARAASLLLLAALALGLALASGAVAFERHLALAPDRIEPATGRAFFARVALPRPSWLCPCAEVSLFEDGRPLGPGDGPSDDVASLGGGRFARERRGIAFSTRDGSDPRTNGRRYEVAVPILPPAWALALLAVAWVLLRRDLAMRALEALERASPARVALALATLALAYRAALALRLAGGSFANVMVGGSPWGDAWGYYAMASELAAGERWDPAWSYYAANRPFYHAFLSALFGLAGPSVAVVQAVQILLGAAATAFVFDGVRRLAPRPVALVAALVQAFSPCDARYALAVMTETLGNALGATALWCGACGLERLVAGARGAARDWAGMGLALAFANLARPVSLPAAALLPLAAAATLWREGLLRARGARFLRAAVALALGVAVPVGAWVARQQLVHGIPSLSGNTAEVLFAATSPRFGTWTSALHDLEPPGATRGEIYAFFQEGVRRNLREQPAFYARNALHHALVAAKRGGAPRLALVAIPLLAAAACLRAGSRRGAALALGLALAAGALTPTAFVRVATALSLVAPIALLLRREPLGLVACVQLASLASMGLTAIAYPRIAYGVAWMAAACVAQLAAPVFARAGCATPLAGRAASRAGAVSTGAGAPAGAPTRSHGSPGGRVAPRRIATALGLGGLAALAALALGAGVVVARNLGPRVPKPSPVVAPADEAVLVARALEGVVLAPLRAHAGDLRAQRAALHPDAAMRLAAFEDRSAWSPLFVARPFDFRVERTRPGVHCAIPRQGAPPARAECPLVWPASLAACPAETVRAPDAASLAALLEPTGRLAGPTSLWIGASVPRSSLATSFEAVARVTRDAAGALVLQRACGPDGAAQVALVASALSTAAAARGTDSPGSAATPAATGAR